MGDWSYEPVEKYLSAQEVVELLQPFGISARIERKQAEALLYKERHELLNNPFDLSGAERW
jgi:hypothetical protein